MDLHDVFICHASEDKDSIARPLAIELQQHHVDVWFDEFSLSLGDSLRRKIDEGLRSCRYGIIILSPSFFLKSWTQYELDGLLQKDLSSKDKTILPIWHQLDATALRAYSLSLADRISVNTAKGLKHVASEILRVIRPHGSPLVAAREILIEWNAPAPVVTDSFWLDAVEASNRLMPFGPTIPDHCAWGRWAFPLPGKGETAEEWGLHIAWSAMQKTWVDDAEALPITPISHPSDVHAFVLRHPGLLETCEYIPSLVAEYAPQVTIPGFEGPLMEAVTAGYDGALEKGDLSDEWSLRHFCLGGDIRPSTVAYEYFHGGMFGPTTSPFEEIDHLVWLFSTDSDWLSLEVKEVMQNGLLAHPIWATDVGKRCSQGNHWESLCCDAVHREGSSRTLQSNSPEIVAELSDVCRNVCSVLNIEDSPEAIVHRLVEKDIIKISRDNQRSKDPDLL